MASPRNSLLQSMPAQQFEQIAHLMEPVTLAPRRTLQHANVPIKHVYFVEEGLVSVLASTDTRNAVEVWLVGREGVVGSAAVLGLDSTPLRYLVQIGGSALRIGVDDLRQAMADQPHLRALLLDDLHTALLRSSQSTACSLSHSFRQRLACWLLTAQDRSDRDEFRITQELLTRILGVRRATVSETIKSLEGRGILARMRGLIKIRDRDRLQEDFLPLLSKPSRGGEERLAKVSARAASAPRIAVPSSCSRIALADSGKRGARFSFPPASRQAHFPLFSPKATIGKRGADRQVQDPARRLTCRTHERSGGAPTASLVVPCRLTCSCFRVFRLAKPALFGKALRQAHIDLLAMRCGPCLGAS